MKYLLYFKESIDTQDLVMLNDSIKKIGLNITKLQNAKISAAKAANGIIANDKYKINFNFIKIAAFKNILQAIYNEDPSIKKTIKNIRWITFDPYQQKTDNTRVHIWDRNIMLYMNKGKDLIEGLLEKLNEIETISISYDNIEDINVCVSVTCKPLVTILSKCIETYRNNNILTTDDVFKVIIDYILSSNNSYSIINNLKNKKYLHKYLNDVDSASSMGSIGF